MLIDSHCHIPHKKYNLSPNELITDSKNNNIPKLITIGTSISENKKVIEVAEEFEDVSCTIGIYPHEDQATSIENLKNSLKADLASSKKIVGIGECGIDITNWQGGRSIEDQIVLFEMQAALALEFNLPLVIHNRNGDAYVLQVLEKYKNTNLKAVNHCFASNWSYAGKLLNLGHYISFSGKITYPNTKDLEDVVKKVPNDRFLVETDAPYLPPQQFRGQVNYPKYVKIVAEKVAQIKQIPLEEAAQFSFKNTCAVFNIC